MHCPSHARKDDMQGGCCSTEQQDHSTDSQTQPPLPNFHADDTSKQRSWRAWLRRNALPAAAGLLCMGLTWAFLDCRQRMGRRKRQLPTLGEGGPSRRQLSQYEGDEDQIRIPLRDVVRFKERQWFIEEVENSRQGDANAMLRLAKMHLHGQGCDRNLPMAQEWLRRARYMGIFATLEEIWAGEPEELEELRAAAIARAARRKAAAAGNASVAGAAPGLEAARMS
ncbi:hypothetical protein DUNSADRAFT_9089 [Dunaliella salina]|uniref:Sel1 repeat family protein n=1 Tax=Dunaliella salina TaxID=3046 RepID=A0ABQ7H5J7_DUNSA|nr:hypothetical protein DUNSADRAFT_9089 [Dunaliella salina]|eukprot:KAF5842130.1 hypothetical protein DUNSADRAFT_9089 [Dunaliella salina]